MAEERLFPEETSRLEERLYDLLDRQNAGVLRQMMVEDDIGVIFSDGVVESSGYRAPFDLVPSVDFVHKTGKLALIFDSKFIFRNEAEQVVSGLIWELNGLLDWFDRNKLSLQRLDGNKAFELIEREGYTKNPS